MRGDDQLVALFRMGYDDAFRAIHDRYRQRLFAYTRQMLGGSRSDAEDVLQDVFLRAYSALRNDDRPVTLRAWLYRVAHNRCIDQLRRPVPPAAEVYQLSRTPLRDPFDETERREDLRDLVKDVQRLPEQQRSALLMRELDGLSYAELADALRTSVPAIKSLLVRARIGLVEAGEARDTACVEIRAELEHAHARGVRATARSRRHLRDCSGCREYRHVLRGTEHSLAALSPGGGPLATLAKLLGIGGASSGAAAGATAGAGGSAAAVVGGATATKVAAIVCCAAVVGGGAVEVREHATTKRHERHAAVHKRAPVAARKARAVPITRVTPPAVRAADPVREHEMAVATKPKRAASHGKTTEAKATPVENAAAKPAAPATQSAPTANPEEAQTGGAMAPDESAFSEPAGTGGDGAPADAPPAPGAQPPATQASAATPQPAPEVNAGTTPQPPGTQPPSASPAAGGAAPPPAG